LYPFFVWNGSGYGAGRDDETIEFGGAGQIVSNVSLSFISVRVKYDATGEADQVGVSFPTGINHALYL
jgi:hypothetical protein